jgi:hypothetical protein
MGSWLFVIMGYSFITILFLRNVMRSEDQMWQEYVEQWRKQGAKPVRPENWSTLVRRQNRASIVVLIFFYILLFVLATFVLTR